MKARIACFKVSAEMLIHLLHLPPGTVIHGARANEEIAFPPSIITFFVEHADIKETEVVGEGDRMQYPEANPQFKQNQPVEFLGWGQE